MASSRVPADRPPCGHHADRLRGRGPARSRKSLELRNVVPDTAPTTALDLRVHRYEDSPNWIDGWRTGALRNIATQQLDDLGRLDAASLCYSISVEVDDPPDLTHLQLAGRWHPRSHVRAASRRSTFMPQPASRVHAVLAITPPPVRRPARSERDRRNRAHR